MIGLMSRIWIGYEMIIQVDLGQQCVSLLTRRVFQLLHEGFELGRSRFQRAEALVLHGALMGIFRTVPTTVSTLVAMKAWFLPVAPDLHMDQPVVNGRSAE